MPVCITEQEAIKMLALAILGQAARDAGKGHKGAMVWLQSEGRDMAESLGVRPSLYREMLSRL